MTDHALRIEPGQLRFQQIVGLLLYPVRGHRIRRSAVGRIVFEAPKARRVVGRRDNDAVSKSCLAPAVVCENRVGNGRGWGIFVPLRDHDFNPVCRQHLKGTGKSRHGQSMGIHTHEQRTVDTVLLAVETDRLADGQDMPLVEGRLECGPAVTRCAECDPLGRDRRVRNLRVVRRAQARHVHQHFRLGRFSRKQTYCHGASDLRCGPSK